MLINQSIIIMSKRFCQAAICRAKVNTKIAKGVKRQGIPLDSITGRPLSNRRQSQKRCGGGTNINCSSGNCSKACCYGATDSAIGCNVTVFFNRFYSDQPITGCQRGVVLPPSANAHTRLEPCDVFTSSDQSDATLTQVLDAGQPVCDNNNS